MVKTGNSCNIPKEFITLALIGWSQHSKRVLEDVERVALVTKSFKCYCSSNLHDHPSIGVV